MSEFGTLCRACLLSAAVSAPLAPVARAAPVIPYNGVGQHVTVMNNIQRAQQRNNAAISHVQNNIRSSRRKAY